VLFWHLLTREEDYAFQRPSLTRRKLRARELKVHAGWRRGRYSGPRVNESHKERERETEFARQAETAYRRLVEDWLGRAVPARPRAYRHASTLHARPHAFRPT
jgi:transposase